MNRNLFKYSLRFAAVLMTAAVFVSCEKDSFTEANALDLELRKLRVQDSIASIKESNARKHEVALVQYQRQIDSLAAIDAAGRVFYTVIPVDGSSAVFATGGRTEGVQGLEDATVTITQWGKALEATSARNGVYTFGAASGGEGGLYSGEVTVTIKRQDYTTANYVANLTPDGPVATGKIVYVGNVVPLFGESAGTKMAVIKGEARIETDLTGGGDAFGNGSEESAALNGTTIAAYIDTERTHNGTKVFWDRYMADGNSSEEGFGVGGGTTAVTGSVNTGSTGVTKSGYIQRIAYEYTTQMPVGTIQGGSYSISVPATASGLPVKLEFSEVGTDRTFYRNNQVVTTRHLYGPNVKSDDIAIGVDPVTLTFKAFTTEATATAAYTDGSRTTLTKLAANDWYFSRTDWWNIGRSEHIKNSKYVVAPAVAVTGNATGAYATASNGTANAQLKFVTVGIAAGTAQQGSDYAANATLTVTRQDAMLLGVGKQIGGVTAGGGSISRYVRIINGGYGFLPFTGNEATVNGQFTNTLPKINFVDPASGTLPLGAQEPSATAVIDKTVGSVAFISVQTSGSGYTTAPNVFPTYGSGGGINSQTKPGDNQKGLFQVEFINGVETGALRFNTAAFVDAGGVFTSAQTLGANGPNASLTPTVITFTDGTTVGNGNGYVFVPDAKVVNNTVNGNIAATAEAIIKVFVNSNINSPGLGSITKMEIIDGGNYTNVRTANQMPALSLNVFAKTNTFSMAPATLTGTGINNYEITDGTYNGSILHNIGDEAWSELLWGKNNTGLGGSNSGNVKDQEQITDEAQVRQILSHTRYLVAFAAPDAAVTGKYSAWGVPTFGSNGSGQVAGVRIINAGSGYQTNVSYKMYLVPNHTIDEANNVGGTYTNSAVVGMLKTSTDDFGNVLAYSTNGWTEAASGKYVFSASQPAFREVVTILDKMEIDLTNKGAGYAQTPEIVVYGGGFRFDNLGNQGYKIAAEVRDGQVIRLNNVGTANNYIQTWQDRSGVTSGWWRDGDKVIIYSDFSDYNSDGGIDKNPVVKIIDALSNNLTMAFAKEAEEALKKGKPIIQLTKDGSISKIDLTLPGSTAAPAWTMLPDITYNQLPSVIVSAPAATGGTLATVSIPVDGGLAFTSTTGQSGFGDATNGSAKLRKIARIDVTNGGTGYALGNWYYNGHNVGNNYGGGTGNDATNMAGQDFKVVGGFGGATGTNGNTGQNGNGTIDNDRSETQTRFDVFSGITYVRDVHYGTGKELE